MEVPRWTHACRMLVEGRLKSAVGPRVVPCTEVCATVRRAAVVASRSV